jgi:CRISPR-associated protein Csb2
MFAVTVTLLHGTFHGGSPDDTVSAGRQATGEWPPSPARLFCALVAAEGTRARCQLTSGEELSWLENQPAPDIYASPPEDVLVSRLRDRYVVVDAAAEGAVQDYPARQARLVRRGVRQSPQDPRITYAWPEVKPSPGQLAALRVRAARVGYLGCADTPVMVVVSDHLPDDLGALWRVGRSSSITLPVPYPGFLQALDDSYDAWVGGAKVRRSWIRTQRVGYLPAGNAVSTPRPERPSVIWLRLDRAVGGGKLLAVTDTLRQAVLDHVQRLLPGGEVPDVLHGHRPHGAEGPQAWFLALPDVGHSRADGRLLGAAVWLPPSTDPDLVQAVRTAVARLCGERLVAPGRFDLELSVFGGERRPWAANPRRWTRLARRWVTATPIVHERWTKHGPGLAEIMRWCRHAYVPTPVVDAHLTRFPALPGALDLHPSQVTRSGRERRPYSHAVIEFAEPVEGPVVIGRSRQLGLGLMAPADPAEPRGGGS